MKRWLIPVAIVVVIAVGLGAFFGGRAIGGGTPSPEQAMKVLQNLTAEQRQALAQSSGSSGAAAGAPTGAAGPGGNMTSGSILSRDANSITVKLSDGSTKLVLYSDSTTISVNKDGSSSDLTTGQEVRVSGTSNSDGTITATSIQCGSLPSGAPPGATSSTTATSGSATTTGASSGSVTTNSAE
jgi:hypothetical protein